MTLRKILLFFVILGLSFVTAKENPNEQKSGNFVLKTSIHDGPRITRTIANIGNWGYWVRYDGQSAHDPNGSSGGFYPRGTAASIYQDGLIFGGYVVGDNSGPRVGGSTYTIGTLPGWVDGSTAISPDDDERVAMYRIRLDYKTFEDDPSKEGEELEGLRSDAAEIFVVSDPEDVTADQLLAVYEQYEHDWEAWPADKGAPFVDSDGNGLYDAAIDTPGLANADQVIWFAYNDFDTASAANLYGADPLGVEIQCTIWGYNQPNSTLGQIVFKKYRFINKSANTIDSMFVSQWSDPDVGTYTDDLAGCDIAESIGFAYSGFRTDGDYESFDLPPAAVGYDFFQGPLVDGVDGQDLNANGVDDDEDFGVFDLKRVGPGKINLPMTSFIFFAAGSPISDPPLGDYEGSLQWYNMLNGNTPTADLDDPTPYRIGSGVGRGEATLFPLSGDPFLGTGDLDAVGDNFGPGDRRIAMNSGPFTMAPGDTQEVVVAIVGGIIDQEGGDNRNAVAQMKLNDQFAQFLYDNLFEAVPSPPSQPAVNSIALEQQVVLNWGSNLTSYQATEGPGVLGFNFEGYNVYQLPTATSSLTQATKIATYDLDNLVQIIRGQKFLPSFGDVVTVPIQKGTDSGISRSILIDRDYVNDLPLYDGNTYYFAVTAYNYNSDPSVPEPSLESGYQLITIVPQPEKPGEKFNNAPGDAIAVSGSAGTGSTSVFVIDPKGVMDKNYTVSFDPTEQYTLEAVLDSNGAIVGYDTLGIWYTWSLGDGSTTLLTGQDNLSGDGSYPIVDGLQVRVEGPKTNGYADWGFSGNRWISGTNWGGRGLFGGLDAGYNFFGSNIGETGLYPMQMVFQDQADVDANGFVAQGAVFRRDLGYAFNGIGDMPFAVYDMRDAANPRQVNVCFVEMDDATYTAAPNLIWDMGWDGTAFQATGAREYIFMMDSDYNGGADYNDSNDFSTDCVFAIWPASRSRDYLLAPFTLDIIANVPSAPGDTYTFSTEGFEANNDSSELAEIKKINVFPNPYYAYHSQEQNRFDNFVTFNHLPQKAKIRIFNLAGTLVRTIEKDGPSQFQEWNLRNESDLPVGNGMYIAHIDLPDLKKEKVLKVMVILGKEVLRFY